MGKTTEAIDRTAADRARRRRFVGAGSAPARMLSRARIGLKANQGDGGAAWRDAALAGARELHPSTVARVRRQCVAPGLDATLARTRPDRI